MTISIKRLCQAFIVSIALTLSSVAIACNSYAEEIQSYEVTDVLDVSNLEEQDIYNQSYFYIDENQNNVKIREEGKDGFSKEVKIKDTPYVVTKMYNTAGHITATAKSLGMIEFGNVYFYDSEGNVTQVVDRDEGYSFSLDDVIKLMKDKYGLDIEKDSVLQSAARGPNIVKEGSLGYKISVYERGLFAKDYHIDGITGEVLAIKERQWANDMLELTPEQKASFEAIWEQEKKEEEEK